jgi:nucleotide-binding universal stress UspA family protein
MVLSEKGPFAMKEVIEGPVTSVRPASKPAFRLRRILAPTDFSANSEKAVCYAIQLARLVGARLTLLHVVPEPSALDYTMQGVPVDEIKGWQEEADAKLANELAKAKLDYHDVDSSLTVALHPRDEIVRAAGSLPADLLVLSTHGYTGWKRALFGSDAEKILEHAPCPVLVIR